MPQKGQITRHEWEGNYYRKYCPHCKTWKVRSNLAERITYEQPGKYPTTEEPKCITRKKLEDGTKTL